ncbi:hypothetical protein J1N35_025380 [Gossypium stocksii]|uniref:Uncharacterized protein n=1 Tax=Gossypium stocksii TaxID=47602 RepID=A0A9D3ZX36_9ROSI|nr:hypothetical protein J1N35_025380 [Gossypium stocksii]
MNGHTNKNPSLMKSDSGNPDEARPSNDHLEAPSTANECIPQHQTQSSTTRACQQQTREPAMPTHSSTDATESMNPPDSPTEFV